MHKYIVIESIGSVSALGYSEKTQIKSIHDRKANYIFKEVHGVRYPIMPIHAEGELELKELLHQFPKYRRSDRTTQLAILSAIRCFDKIKNPNANEWVINAGSSRGATGIWENYHAEFLKEGTVPVKSSPLTTLGNISTHVAQHQKLHGFQIDHSITCSSGLQALANGFAWLRSGLTNHFLAIGTESPLTEFTIAQMAALGIYTNEQDEYPCKPCAQNTEKTNTFMLGEGAVAIALSNTEEPANGCIYLAGMGTASEIIPNPTAISPYGDAFRMSMLKAIENAELKSSEIDLVIPHSPGTFQGDMAEFNAISTIFGEKIPSVINHKFLTGHTLGASGLLSVELGYLMLTENLVFDFPYTSLYPTIPTGQPLTVLVNSMGFGGNAVSIVLKKWTT